MEDHWYKNVVVYTVDVKSFCDSNGDGIGDFPGLTSKLGYISELGITCLWLLPFFPSPWRDNGYDVKDYLSVDPRLGTPDDFDHFIREASERGISVVIDLVMNHTSNEHPWFLAAKKDRNSVFRDYYVWSEVPPPQDPLDRPAFPDTEHGVWHYEEGSGSYYYHKFYHFQPDLQVANPKVRNEIQNVLDYWLSQGVAGFRLDAAPIMIHKKGLERTRPANSHEILSEMRKFLASRRKGTILLGEVDVDGHQLIDYFAEGGGLHLVFNFLLSAYLMGAVAQMKAETLIRGWRELPVIPNGGSWLNFLRNLDEFNTNQLPGQEKEAVYEILGPDPTMRIYGRGVRRRLASMLGGNADRIEMAYSLLFSLPGTPMLNYGDEIGMGENLELWERESVRTPMQWTSGTTGGFSSCSEKDLYRSMVEEKEFHHSKVNVESQLQDPYSLLNKMKGLILARKSHPEIGNGRMGWVDADHPSVVSHICHWKNDMLLAVHNLSDQEVSVELNLRTIYAKRLKRVLGNCEVKLLSDGDYEMEFRPFGYAWFTVHYQKEE